MIKFFRKIRQRFISEGKLSKYLIYAIGEIVLVVIGILIALQINNWNESRKQDNEVAGYLELMVQELREDVEFYDLLKERGIRRIAKLSALTNGQFDVVDLKDTPELISMNYDARNFGTAYMTLKQNGDLNKLYNAGLRDEMVTYYEEIAVLYNNISEWHKNFVAENVEVYIMQNLPLLPEAITDPDVVLSELKKNAIAKHHQSSNLESQ